MWLYALIAILLLVAIGVQVYYAQANRAQATRTLKVIVGVNITLLLGLLAGVGYLAYSQAVR